MLYIGLMSGTSLDGIDAALADLDADDPLVGCFYEPFPPALKSALEALLKPGFDELARAALVANELTSHYAHAVNELQRIANVIPRDIRAIGCHGQTLRHNPGAGFSVQLVNGALLAELSGIDTVCDFRSRDIASGGQGAPLVPAFHAARFQHANLNRAIINIGGIANVTCLPAGGTIRGFDCGPGNALLDAWIEARCGRGYDTDGAWAASGTVITPLLSSLLSHPFLFQAPPKSTGRDVFCLDWVSAQLEPSYAAQDVQATLAEFTARSVVQALTRWCAPVDEVYLCGGGAHNVDLVRRIGKALPGKPLASTGALGIDADWVEALAFAWLAREFIERRPGNIAAVTGAAGPRYLGCLYPA